MLNDEKFRISLDGHFFFASVLGHLDIREDKSIDTACTDGTFIKYNPEWFKTLTFQNRCAVLCHEVLHVAMRHPERAYGYEHERANIAMDYAINPLIPYPLPAGGLLDKKYEGKTWEWIYDHLPPSTKAPSKPGGGGQGNGRSDPGRCGSVVPGPANPVVQQAVAQATAIAQQMGKLPAGLSRALGIDARTRVPWGNYLDRFLADLLEAKYDWCCPEEDHVYHGVYVPKFSQEPRVGYLVFAVDTSGSIDDKALSMFAAEVAGACRTYQPARVRVMFADAEVAADYDDAQDDVETALRKPKGGGGTDFRPVFDKLAGDQPDGLVYLTDLYGTFPAGASEYPVLWVTDTLETDPPWGEKVTMR